MNNEIERITKLIKHLRENKWDHVGAREWVFELESKISSLKYLSKERQSKYYGFDRR